MCTFVCVHTLCVCVCYAHSSEQGLSLAQSLAVKVGCLWSANPRIHLSVSLQVWLFFIGPRTDRSLSLLSTSLLLPHLPEVQGGPRSTLGAILKVPKSCLKQGLSFVLKLSKQDRLARQKTQGSTCLSLQCSQQVLPHPAFYLESGD